jgi:hypothetical protein
VRPRATLGEPARAGERGPEVIGASSGTVRPAGLLPPQICPPTTGQIWGAAALPGLPTLAAGLATVRAGAPGFGAGLAAVGAGLAAVGAGLAAVRAGFGAGLATLRADLALVRAGLAPVRAALPAILIHHAAIRSK